MQHNSAKSSEGINVCAQKLDALIASVSEIRQLLPEVQSTLIRRIAPYEEQIRELMKEMRHTNAFAMAGSFEVQRRCLELLRLLEPNGVKGFHKARFGSAHDGGYVMIDDFAGVAAAFSFGIANDANWDADIADRGVPVHQFDHTIDAPPIIRRDLIWTKSRIAAEPAEGACTIDQLVGRYGTPGKASLILKIDIEGDEWAVFDSVSETALSCFTQIVAEFHFLKNIAVNLEWHSQALHAFKKLSRNFGVVHVHANNMHGITTSANVWMPHILEITFANRRRYSLGSTDEIFPGPLDAPNNPDLPDIHLGRFIY